MLSLGEWDEEKEKRGMCMVAIVSVVQIMDRDLINGTRNDEAYAGLSFSILSVSFYLRAFVRDV